jgi:hypothetical protein
MELVAARRSIAGTRYYRIDVGAPDGAARGLHAATRLDVDAYSGS